MVRSLNRWSLRIPVLLVILLVGAVLRLYRLGAQSLWVDEGWSLWLAESSIPTIVELTAQDVHPPLFYTLLHFWVEVFGATEVGMRSFSAVASILAMLAIYAVGRTLVSEPVGIGAAALLAISPFGIRHAQIARMYSLLLLLSLLCFYCFIRWIRDDELMGAYIASSLALLYTHVFGGFILLAQSVYMVTATVAGRSEQPLRKWFTVQAAIGVLYMPWLVILVSQALRHASENPFYDDPTIRELLFTFISQTGGYRLLVLFLALGGLVVIDFERLSDRLSSVHRSDLRGFISNSVRVDAFWRVNMLITWWVLPALGPFVLAVLASPFYADRYAIGGLGVPYLLAAWGLVRIYQWRGGAIVVAVIAAIVLIPLSVTLSTYYGALTVDHEQWDDAANRIEMDAEPGDLIVMNDGNGGSRVAFEFYLNRDDIVIRPFPNRTSRHVGPENIDELGPMTEGHNRVWLVLSHSRDCEGRLIQWLDGNYTLISRYELEGIDLYHFNVSVQTGGRIVPDSWPRSGVTTSC